MSKKQTINIVESYIRKVKAGGIPVSLAYVFGSRIKGGANPASDIDTCIVSPMFGKNRFDERKKLMTFSEGISNLIEPHPYSPADFESKFDPLAHEIKKTGLRIAV